MAMKINSINAQRALEQLGGNLKMARLKRRISLQDFADRIGVSKRTVMRMEKGDEGVSIGALAMACLVLGELERIEMFLDPGSDDMGLLLDRDNLPKRIDGQRKSSKATAGLTTDPNVASAENDEGVAF